MDQDTVEEVYHYKIVLLGDSKVGKTSLRRNFMGESYQTNYLTTLMADFASHTLDVDGYTVNFSIWDLAGQPDMGDVRSKYFYGAFGAMIVFDVTNPSSFENLDKWIDQLKRNTMQDGTPIVIVANKMDLENAITVDFDQVDNYIEKLKKRYKYPVHYIKTSAKTGHNVEKAFLSLARNIHSWKLNERKNKKK